MNADQIFAECYSRGMVTAAQAAEAGHPVTDEGRRRRRIHWQNSSDPDVRAAYEAGRMQGYLEADDDLIRALATMLGGPDAKSYRHGAELHEKDARKAALRARADAHDPELLEAWREQQERTRVANERRLNEAQEIGRRYAPISDWAVWRDYCDQASWDRICSEYAAAGWPLPPYLVGRRRHLQAVA